MYDVLRMGRKAFTVSVVVATIAWSIGLAALLMPLAAGAASVSSGDLIKGSLAAVYYYGADGKRYVFPNEKTYKTWYSDFSSVKTITDAELAAISIGGNATYKPGAKMVKITTDPKVYAVDAGGTLRWVNSETMAANLYGTNWNKEVDDVPDAFFVNYKTGSDIAQAADYVKATVTAAATSINVDKGLSSATGATGTLTIATDSSSPAGGSILADVGDGGQQRAKMLSVKLTAGSSDVKVTKLKLRRGGISKDGDVDNLLVMDGNSVLAEAQSVNDNIATFSATAGLLTVSANSSKVVDVVMNVNKDMANGSTVSWSLAAADVTSDAASVSGSAVGSSMTCVVVTDFSNLEVGQTNTYPASVDPGTLGKEMWRLSFAAQSQDVLLTHVKLNQLGSVYDSDIQNLKLMDGATQLNGTVAQVKDKVVEFDMSTMSGGGYKILAGVSKQLTLNGDIVAGTSRTIRWSIQKQEDVRAKDLEYNVATFVDDYDATDDDAFGIIQAGSTTSINTGTLSIGLNTGSPNTYVADGASGVLLAKFNFKASGEDVKVTALTVICTASTTTRPLVNTMVKLDGVQVGSTDSTATCDATTDEAVYSFGNSFILTAGKTHEVTITGDLTNSAWVADDTIYVGFGGTAAAQGKTSLTAITPTNINGHTVTLKGATVTVIKDQSFADRSSSQPTGVTNAQNVKVGAFVVVAGSGEAADISQFVLRDDETYQAGEDFQNLVLKDRNGTQIGTTISSLTADGTASTYTFTPAASIRLEKGAQKAFDVFADVKGSVTNGSSALNNLEVDTVSATGADTGSSANFGTSGNDSTDVDLQNFYLALHGNLTVDESADSAVAQQLVLGSTGVSLAKFKLTADAAENISLTEFVVSDDMTVAGKNTRRAATGSLKNFKLYKGDTLLASVAALDETYNTTTPTATFTGFSVTIPKSENIVLEVKADLTSFVDGGKASSSHKIMVPVDTKTSAAGTNNPVMAVGAGSGITMSLNGLDINGSTVTGNTDADVGGSVMDLVRAKLTLAHAADSPSGASTAGSEQTVAKFVASNSSNVGNYALTIIKLNFEISSSGASMTGTSADLKVFKDSISTANQLATTDYCNPAGCTRVNFVSTEIAEGSFTDLEIAAGSSKTLIVTLETNNAGFEATETLSVGINQAADIIWHDGNDNGSGSNDNYYTVDSLPLAGKTLVY